jgi:large subunit ribosomal protein L10
MWPERGDKGFHPDLLDSHAVFLRLKGGTLGLTRKDKEKEVAWLKESFQDAKALVLTDYKGLTVSEITDLRSQLREQGIAFKVVKNTLVRLAAPGTDIEALTSDAVGPRAAAWTTDTDGAPAMAKVLVEYAKKNPKLELVSGVLQGTKMSAADLEDLSKLPSRDELVGKLLGTMIAPVGSFVNTLAAVPRSLLNVLKAIEQEKANSAGA